MKKVLICSLIMMLMSFGMFTVNAEPVDERFVGPAPDAVEATVTPDEGAGAANDAGDNGADVTENGAQVNDENGYQGIVAVSGELANSDADGDGTQPDAPWWSMLWMPAALIALFYFMILRPRKKQEKKMKDMMSSIKVTDEVVSIGGIHGKIVRVKDDTYVIETGVGNQKSYVQIEKSAISRVSKEGSGRMSSTSIPEEVDVIEVESSDDE